MQILGLAHAIPQARLDVDWILAKLNRENAATLPSAERAQLLTETAAFLQACGSETRHQLAPSERPIDLVADATRRALAASGVGADDVDLVVYAGVARGWLEPAMAHAVQAAAGLRRATCFDVLDGCASWLRSLHVTRRFLHAGDYRCALIVNAEAGFADHGRWQFSSLAELEAYVATYTIGEAATATVVAGDAADDFYCTFRSLGEAHDLCMIPLANAGAFMPGPATAVHSTPKFFSHAKDLMTQAIRLIGETFHSDPVLPTREYDISFGHEASEKATAAVTRILRQRPERHFAIHRQYGNAVSASVPLAMSLALECGRLQRGQQVLIVVAASGITIGFAAFTF